MRRVVAVGHRSGIAELTARFRRERYHGMEIVAACLPADSSGEIEEVPVLGDFTDVPLVVQQVGADTVAVLACPELDGTALRRLAWRLERTRTDLIVAPALMEVAGPRTAIRPVAGLPLLHVEHPEIAGTRQLIKTGFDRLVAGVALVLLAPLMLVVAIAVRASSPGPVLFRQTRVGKDGVEFTILKFRTMRDDAEARKVELVNEGHGLLFKIRQDPRVTRMGVRLRWHSLDELPQLINVLRGHMSLVGPRPPLPEEVARYRDDVRRRLVVRPGMTGLWQVNGRSDLSWEESVRLDLRYIENWSLMLDLQILWKTWSAVAGGAGAY
jgi:exopolysaccharide biosynthesis polyprenyl glycosylphosphotransferase